MDDNLSAEAVSQRLKAIGTSALEGYPCELSDTDAQALIQAATTLEQVKREHGETFRNAVGWQTRAQAAERERDEARADFQRRDLDALDQMLARAAAEAQVEALRKALEEIRDLKPRKKELPADHWDQIRACPECQRYAGHPVQQGICDAHRRPMWDREKHNAHEESILGYRAMEIARNALASSPERKPCTCHPADNPPVPCAGKYALTECRKAEESSAKAPTSEAVHRVCRVIKGDCLGCPESEMVHGDQCQRGCYAQAVECINTVETGNPWRKTGGVRAPWTVLAPAEARSDRPAPQTYAEAVAAYNAVYDPAFEAGQEVFNAGFREGWMFAVYPDGPDGYEEAAEHYSRSVDGVELGEAWDAHRDAFFARLPLAALPPLPTPPKAEAE